MRHAVAAALAAGLAVPASAVGVSGPGVVNFPDVPIRPKRDRTAHGYLSPAIYTVHKPSFCWELSLATRSQPLFFYLRRAGTGRVVVKVWIGDNHVPPQPWSGSGYYSGCAFIPRADERAFLHHPRRYYLDVRTQTARHAAVAYPHGPRLA